MTDDVGRKPIAITWLSCKRHKENVEHAEGYEKHLIQNKKTGNIE